MRRKPSRSLGKKSAAVLIAVALLFTACGNDDQNKEHAADTFFNEIEENARSAYQCLRDHGLEMEDRSFKGNDFPGSIAYLNTLLFTLGETPDGIQAATACAQQLKSMAGPFGDQEQVEKFLKGFNKFAGCMREKGYSIPDIDLTNPSNLGIDLDINDPAIEAAAVICEKESGLRLPG